MTRLHEREDSGRRIRRFCIARAAETVHRSLNI